MSRVIITELDNQDARVFHRVLVGKANRLQESSGNLSATQSLGCVLVYLIKNLLQALEYGLPVLLKCELLDGSIIRCNKLIQREDQLRVDTRESLWKSQIHPNLVKGRAHMVTIDEFDQAVEEDVHGESSIAVEGVWLAQFVCIEVHNHLKQRHFESI